MRACCVILLTCVLNKLFVALYESIDLTLCEAMVLLHNIHCMKSFSELVVVVFVKLSSLH